MVSVRVPGLVFELMVIVKVEVQAGVLLLVIEAGLKLEVAFDGNQVTEGVTVPLNPASGVTVTV